MKKGIGIALIFFGLLFILVSSTEAGQTPNLSFLIGTYLPGLVCLAIGAALRGDKLPADVEAESPLKSLQLRRKSYAEMGVVGGIALMLMGSGLSRQYLETFLLGAGIALCGWCLLLWGTAHYARWKGYSGWLGLFALLLLPGLIVLACLPNKLKDAATLPADNAGKSRSVVAGAVLASGLLLATAMAAFLTLPWVMSQFPRSPRDVAWTTVTTDPPKFTVEMPGKFKREEFPQAGPNGETIGTTYMYQSGDGIATYMAGFTPCPPEFGTIEDPAEILKTLDIGLDAYAAQVKGQVLDRKTIAAGKHPGREQIVEFDAGVKDRKGQPVTGMAVCRSYFVRDSILVMMIILGKNDRNRPEMEARMARFFDSLKPD